MQMSAHSQLHQEGSARGLANLVELRVVQSDLQTVTVELTRDELLALNNGLNEVCHGPDSNDEGEFHTRMGVERHEPKSLLDAVSALVSD